MPPPAAWWNGHLAALLSLVFFGPKTLWGLVGLVPLVTGLIGSCPLYSLLGLRTCPMEPVGR